ncbi:MAG: hypothetical protein O2865_07140 [Planctomycetota bacterium]|nr:hypothetical protein [Planctomycetota bacterium]MDA0933272.1 hypothetical protein [Planctomycetota bacterium]MDA1220855.1 hypothetical protein [Planctomycetota bacterium]
MISFWVSFLLTLGLLVGAVWTGAKGMRRAHFCLAPAGLVALAVTIVLTERLLRAVEFPKEEMRIHLWFAKSAAALVLPVVITGFLNVRRPNWRRIHAASVGLFFVAALIATGTGIWVFTLATPR